MELVPFDLRDQQPRGRYVSADDTTGIIVDGSTNYLAQADFIIGQRFK